MSGAAPGNGRGDVRSDITSPCINVCRMDDASGLCIGCLRTLDEIAGWSRASDEGKRAIIAAVERRRGGTSPATTSDVASDRGT